MLEKLRQKTGGEKRYAFSMIVLSIIVLILLLNLLIVRSSILGIPASFLFVIIGGILLGNTFFQEDILYFKLAFGFLSLSMLLVLAGATVLLLFRLNILFVSILTLCLVTGAIFIASLVLGKRKEKGENSGSEKPDRRLSFPVAYIPYIAFAGYCLFLVFSARSSWVYGAIWDVLPDNFLLFYLLSNIALLGAFFSRGKTLVKLSLIAFHSVFSLSLFILVVESGFPLYDPWVHIGYSVTLFEHGSTTWGPISSLAYLYGYIAERGLPIFVSVITEMLRVDIFWVQVLSVPILWGVFVPLIAYKITKLIGGGNRSSLLSAFLTVFCFSLIGWATVPETDSFGYVLLFFSIFLFLRYLSSGDVRTITIMFVTVAASIVADPLPGILSLSFMILAFGVKKYESIKISNVSKAYALLATLLILCTFLVPLGIILRGRISPAYGAMYGFPAFSIDGLLSTDGWHLIFGESIDFSFRLALLSQLPLLLGAIGLGYTLRHKSKYNASACLFLLSAFIICLIDYRTLQYAMVKVPFGPGRIVSFRDLTILPFTGIMINSLAKLFPETFPKAQTGFRVIRKSGIKIIVGKRSFAIAIICISVSSFASAVVDENYAARRGLQVTGFEMGVVKYIDDYTPERYVVIAEPRLWSVGIGYVGFWNPEKLYVCCKESKYDRIDSDPSVDNMMWAMRQFEASVGYFLAVSHRTLNYEEVVERASLIFRPYAIFHEKDLEISVFRYEIPRLTSSDVTTFYWDLPPTYFIQNDLMQVSINPSRNQLEVRDHWGTLYEGLNFSEMLSDGNNIGNMTSIDYFIPEDSYWVEWKAQETIPYSLALSQQFRFKLNFEKASLIGVVERGKPFVQLLQEAGQNFTLNLFPGDFTRLYLPGLVGGQGSYNITAQPFGLLYTISRTSGVILHPAYKYEINTSSLTLNEIQNYCRLNVTKGYMWYDLYVHNNADDYQWAYIEVWLPDRIDGGMFPRISYSTDEGETWVPVTIPVEPIKTLDGVDVNWVVSKAREWSEKPVVWTYYSDAAGSSFTLPENFTDSGGGQNRLLFGLYLPARDKALLRFGPYIYRTRPLKLTYVFTDSADLNYGLRGMNDNFIAIYNIGSDVHVGGLALSTRPMLLAISEDETGIIKSISATVPSNVTLSLLAAKDLDTRLDLDIDGVPDVINRLDDDTVGLRAHESIAMLSYEIQDFADSFSLKARISYFNEWGSPLMVTICVPYEFRNDGGTRMFERRGLSKVLRASILNNETETIVVYKT